VFFASPLVGTLLTKANYRGSPLPLWERPTCAAWRVRGVFKYPPNQPPLAAMAHF